MLTLLCSTRFKTAADRDIHVKALAVATPHSVKEPGMVYYRITADLVDPLLLHTVEIYKSVQAIVDHLASDHIAELARVTADAEAEIKIMAYEGDLTPVDVNALLSEMGMTGLAKATFAAA
jgi:quinol monooxygenase YgiN